MWLRWISAFYLYKSVIGDKRRLCSLQVNLRGGHCAARTVTVIIHFIRSSGNNKKACFSISSTADKKQFDVFE